MTKNNEFKEIILGILFILGFHIRNFQIKNIQKTYGFPRKRE
jgi:hypothetical protein